MFKGNPNNALVGEPHLILLCVFLITVVASYHVGERDVLFFQYVLICFLPIFLQYCEHICCVCVLIKSAFVRPASFSLLANKEILE